MQKYWEENRHWLQLKIEMVYPSVIVNLSHLSLYEKGQSMYTVPVNI